MQAFTFQNPTRINFGEGAVHSSGDCVRELGGSKVLLVTDAVLKQAGVIQPVLDSFKRACLPEPLIFSEVPPDSDVESVQQAIRISSGAGCDLVVAIGGGSVLDTAKATNIGLSLGGDVRDFEGINNLPGRLKPLIAIPTTAGTGSEVSAVAMIKDNISCKKLLFASNFLFADVAILDPALLVSLPPHLTAATGVDALTHCIESFVSTAANVVSDSLCLEAMGLLFKYLWTATSNGANLEARSFTMLASSMAGLAFTNTGVGVVHALSHAVGGKFGTHHGMTNAVLLPFGMSFNMSCAQEKYARAWRYLCGTFTNTNNNPLFSGFVNESQDKKAAILFVETVKEFMKLCGLPKNLQALGIPELEEEDLFELATVASIDPAILFNPREATVGDLVKILKGAY